MTRCLGMTTHNEDQDTELLDTSQNMIWEKCGWSELDVLPGPMQKLLEIICMIPIGYTCKL